MLRKKHAYLILAHTNWYVLEKLILLIDDERNDIFIHIDKKTKDFDFSYFRNLHKKSNITFVNQVDVRWGHVSLVEAEFNLFREAFNLGEYTYYHLLSGSDLPLKNQEEIHLFFRENEGKEFLGFSDAGFDIDRVDKIHLFPKYMRAEAHESFKRLLRKMRLQFISLQRRIGYSRTRNTHLQFVFGSQWASLTSRFVEDILKEEKAILEFYKYSNCSDEIYKQTFAYNSVYKNAIYDFKDELKGCQRFMDWKRGQPYTFREEDLDLILSSYLLFARKFEEPVDKKIVDKIFDTINQSKRY